MAKQQKTKVKSEYNPDGLMVSPILEKIQRAFEYDTKIPIGLCMGFNNGFKRPSLIETVTHEVKWGEFPIITSTGGITICYRNLLDADKMSLKDGDERLADEILDHPMLLLFSPAHTDAVARWVYAKSYGVRPQTRKIARQLLDVAKLAKQGAPYRFRGNLTLLREAYEELVAYGAALRLCIRNTRLPEIVQMHFTDCRCLEEVGCVDPASLAGHPARDIPTGKQLAEQVFQELVGWSRTWIKKKLYPDTA